MAIIKNIIFDLDDTLFDTYGLLVTPATIEACQNMIDNGLNAKLEACITKRKELQKSNLRENIFNKIADHFGVTKNTKEFVAQAGRLAFHRRRIKEDIKTFPDTKAVLEKLKTKYNLYLVTIGDVNTQDIKIHLLGLASYFTQINIVDINKDPDKRTCFKKILAESKAETTSFVSIGNRIDTDVAFAKELGMQGVLFEHGEYLHLKPQSEFEKPDFKVKNLNEFERWLNNAG